MSPRAERILAAVFVLFALVAVLVTTDHRLRYLERANELGIGGAAAAGRAERVRPLLPAPYADGFMWLTGARELVASGRARLHWTTSDNAPLGRPMHWSSLNFWWLLALGAVGRVATGAPFAIAVEEAAPYAGPALLALALPLLAWMAARRAGAWGALVVALALAGAFPLAECFYAGNVDHHGMIAAAVMATGLALAAAGGGWVTAGDEPRARRWIVASGIAAAIGLWLSAVSLVVVIASTGLGAAASALLWRGANGAGVRADGSAEPAALAPWPDGWRLWGWAGGVASLAFYLIEYFPGAMGMRLEVNHPLYAIAFIGGGELLCALWRWRRDGTLARADVARTAVATIAVAALPAAVVAGGSSWYALRDPLLWGLHQDIEEFRSLGDLITRTGGVLPALSPLPLVLVAGVLLAADRSRRPAERSLLLVALGPALALLLLALWQTRWIGLWLATLAVLGVTAIGLLVHGRPGRPASSSSFASRWQSTIWVTLLVPLALELYGTFEMVASAAAQAESRAFVPDDLLAALIRDMAIVIAEDPAAPARPIVLASPDVSVVLAYCADIRTIGTLYWENRPGLQAAVEMFAAPTAEEARALLRARQVSHVLLLSERGFIGTSYKLVHGHLDQEAARNTFFGRLIYGGETPPTWLRPLPYQLPIARLGDRPLHAILLAVAP